MGRQARRPVDGCIYHVLNRRNCRMDIFSKPGDFQSFLKLMEEGRQRHSMRILGYCLQLCDWPFKRPPQWQQHVNQLLDAQTLAKVHQSIARNRPFGDDAWTTRVARRYGLESSLRDPWRPRKRAKKAV